MSTTQPGIRLIAVVLVDAIYHLNGESASSDKLNGEYDIQISLGIADAINGELHTTLEVKLTNKLHPEIVDISARVVGKFAGQDDELNAFAPDSGMVLFPYLRSYISTITSWGPMNSITLPLMNVRKNALLKMIAAETKDSTATSTTPPP